MYSTHKEGKSIVSERFIRTYKEQNLQIHNFSTKNVYIDKLHDIVNKYSNTYHSTK